MAKGRKANDSLSALKNLATGNFNEDDRQAGQAALFDGQLNFIPGSENITVEGDVTQSIIVKGNNTNIRFELPEKLFNLVRERILPTPSGIAPPFPPSVFIGREGELDIVKGLLGIVDKGRPKNNVTIIRGFPGVGKTTLVGVIGRDPDTAKTYSDGVLWASLTKKPNGGDPDLLSEMAKWGRALGTDELLRAPTLSECSAQLGYLLQDKRMLLILDDVWEPDHAVHFLKAAGSKCAVLITTREYTKVANYFASTPDAIYILPVLTEGNAIKLLRVISPSAVGQYPKECRRLVQSLECLPLALHVAGRLINSEQGMGLSVPKLLKSIEDGAAIIAAIAPADRIEGETIPTVKALLNKSTDLLDERTRECFAYLGPFAPKPASFDLNALKFVWEVKDPTPIVRTLVGHGLMEYVGAGRYQMHALLVSHANSFLT